LGSLMGHLDTWRIISQTDTPDRLAERVLNDSGYLDMLRNDKDTDAKARIDNLKELIRALQDYPDVGSFLDHVALVADADAASDDAVRLTTIHAAKGLEFPTVFLPGFEEGLFPHQRVLNEEGQKGLEEERRLAYVALTRAKQRLVISTTHGRRLYGQYVPGTPSRFVAEIPAQHLTKHSATPAVFGGGFNAVPGGYSGAPRSTWGYGTGSRTGFAQRPAVGSRADARSSRTGADYASPAEPLIAYENESQVPVFDDADGGTLRVGVRVHHPKFGAGVVQALEGSGEAQMVSVKFTHAGLKKLLASLANLQVS
jgi:DNA helicase II / ATP-dependent DNA helicase PcrA